MNQSINRLPVYLLVSLLFHLWFALLLFLMSKDQHYFSCINQDSPILSKNKEVIFFDDPMKLLPKNDLPAQLRAKHSLMGNLLLPGKVELIKEEIQKEKSITEESKPQETGNVDEALPIPIEEPEAAALAEIAVPKQPDKKVVIADDEELSPRKKKVTEQAIQKMPGNNNGKGMGFGDFLKMSQSLIKQETHKDGEHPFNRDGDPKKLPFVEEIKYWDYMEKLSAQLQNTFSMDRFRKRKIIPGNEVISVKFEIDKLGNMTNFFVINPSSRHDMNQLVVDVFKFVGPFDPLPRTFLKNESGLNHETLPIIINVHMTIDESTGQGFSGFRCRLR